MNAVKLLGNDHGVVKELFTKVNATTESELPAIFKKIKPEPDVQPSVEKTIFYPQI